MKCDKCGHDKESLDNAVADLLIKLVVVFVLMWVMAFYFGWLIGKG